MGQLLVRNVDDSLVARLKSRAAGNGRSVEAEHREILRTALADDPSRRLGVEALREEFRRLQREAPIPQDMNAVDLIREDRDSR